MYKLIILLISTLFSVSGCTPSSPSASVSPTPEAAQSQEEASPVSENKNPIVTITMEDGGVMTAELYPDVAPQSVANFISLANSGFYDGVIFHRVIPGFMIQGGDPTGTGMGGPDYSIKGEFTSNGFQNDLKHTEGVLSMARSRDPNSAGSQFFVMVADSPHLDGQYAAFGKLTDGLDVAKAIVAVPRDGQDKPKADQKIKSIRVDTFGKDYGEPEKLTR